MSVVTDIADRLAAWEGGLDYDGTGYWVLGYASGESARKAVIL